MARPRRRPATAVAEGPLDDGEAWRDRYGHLGDDDLERLADRLARAARWAAHGADTPPQLHGTASQRLDLLDAWLADLDPGRRRYAWHATTDQDRPTRP